MSEKRGRETASQGRNRLGSDSVASGRPPLFRQRGDEEARLSLRYRSLTLAFLLDSATSTPHIPPWHENGKADPDPGLPATPGWAA
jgi:hypothetical protein